MVSSEPSNLRKKWVPGEMMFSPWWKSFEFCPSIFFPKCRIGVECEFTLIATRVMTWRARLPMLWWSRHGCTIIMYFNSVVGRLYLWGCWQAKSSNLSTSNSTPF
jgi:hypothetical protein